MQAQPERASMLPKSRPSSKRRTTRKPGRSQTAYPSLARGPTPKDRLAERLRQAEASGVRPMDEPALDALGEVWPPGENVDEFLAWLRQSR